MNNLQDELAWLNHRLDNKLEEWRKLHRLHGRFNAFLMYCLLISLIVILFKWSSLSTVENAPYVFAISVATVGSMLSFGVLSWMLYGRLLTMGHKSKGGIEHSHLVIPRIAEGSFLEECRGEFNNLLRIERSFPFSDDVRRCIVKCQMVRQLQSKLKGVKSQLIEVENQLESLKANLKRIVQRLSRMRSYINRTKQKISGLTSEVEAVKSRLKVEQSDTPSKDGETEG